MKRSRDPYRLGLILLLAVASWSCGSETGPTAPTSGDRPGTDTASDFLDQPSFTFLVYRTNAQGVESLRWSGTSQGPSADSPEATSAPFVGYGQPFRIAWRIEALGDRVYGHWFKPVDDFVNWAAAPGPVGSAVRSFTFENSTRQEELSLYGCGEDLDCIGQLYLEETEILFQVAALNALGVTVAVPEGRLPLHVGFPAETIFEEEGPPLQYRTAEGAGPFSFADGDTLPFGAEVSIRTRATFEAESPAGADPDSFCCNMDPLGETEAFVRSRLAFGSSLEATALEFALEAVSDSSRSTVAFEVGPYSHRLRSMAIDQNGVLDPTPLVTTFHGGFAPRVTAIHPEDDTQIVLRNPANGDPWPENEVAYEFSGPVTRFWFQGEFVDEDPGVSPDERWPGRYFYLPLRLEGEGPPQEPSTTVRAFGFQWTTEVGAEGVQESPLESSSADDLEFHRVTSENQLELSEDLRIRIFIPELIWLFPSLFQPGSQHSIAQAIGEYLRQSLGDVTVLARGRTTAEGDVHQIPASLDGSSTGLGAFPSGEYGRVSDLAQVELSVRLGIEGLTPTGTIQSYFPPLAER